MSISDKTNQKIIHLALDAEPLTLNATQVGPCFDVTDTWGLFTFRFLFDRVRHGRERGQDL
jgi:hypothetical protein